MKIAAPPKIYLCTLGKEHIGRVLVVPRIFNAANRWFNHIFLEPDKPVWECKSIHVVVEEGWPLLITNIVIEGSWMRIFLLHDGNTYTRLESLWDDEHQSDEPYILL